MADPRLEIAPCDMGAVARLEGELGLSGPAAQVLVRRGLAEPAAARAWLAADARHGPPAFPGIATAAEAMLAHVRAGTRITVHGDYDVDGVCSTAILVGCLRRLGGDVDWYLPSRTEDGYGLSAATVERLTARGTRLLVTVDCAITAVEEVAVARAAGLDVVVTDHHAPRADGRLPDASLVHPGVQGYPCPQLCAAGVAHVLAAALLEAAGEDPAQAEADLDLVALATVADCVPLVGENRRLVREGLRALAVTPRPGLRALMATARVDPARLDARALGFRLAPRINAAGRLHRADAGLELILTEDPDRAARVAEELERANAERRHVETRILFSAEAQVRQAGERPAYVLAGEDWHPGVIGIVASRIAERHHRPAVLIALDGATGTGSGRSIPGFDLLAGLDAAAVHLRRHGGHRAAAGCTLDAGQIDAFRAAFEAHAAEVLCPEDLTPVERADAVVGGDELGLELAEELERLGPFGTANPEVRLLVAGARLDDARPMGEEGRHVRFAVRSGGHRARAVAFGTGGRLPCPPGRPADATFALEASEWNGAVEPRLVLRHARAARPMPITLVGEPYDALGTILAAATTEGDGGGAREGAPASLSAPAPAHVRDRRGGGIAGTLMALVHSGEPVLALAADAPLRARHLAPLAGGFGLCDHAAFAREPALADGYAHVVAVDPPPDVAALAALLASVPGRTTHLAWGEAELGFAAQIHERDHDLRVPLAALYRALRGTPGAVGEQLEALLCGEGSQRRPPALAGRCLRVLSELELVHVDAVERRVELARAQRTALERSATFRAASRRREEGRAWLRPPIARAA
ncbi:MAG TPA: single-stranded-DNA-specific exonuclease RecJ [Solirubrobacteraceae bacterium]|nr:single-stranded-DNA-specific exonuclease RecJ [Solirubrobacteraceae bacterium]